MLSTAAKNKLAGVFGSYGWSGEAVRLITGELEAMKFAIAAPGLRIQYVPDKEGLAACEAFGRQVAEAMST